RGKSNSGKPALLFFFVGRGRRANRWLRRRSCIRLVAHSLLEFLDARPQTAHQFRDPAPTEQNHHDNNDQQQLHRSKFHKASLQHPFLQWTSTLASSAAKLSGSKYNTLVAHAARQPLP